MQNLEAFRGFAELNLKVYLSMESKTCGFPKQGPDLAASREKSKRFRWEV